ncbi:MAG: DUF2169 domain-containing protein [Polyangiaceae bacterium]
MSSSVPGPEIVLLSPVHATTVACQVGGGLWATLVVKATFQLVHGEAARAIEPEPILKADVRGSQGGGLVRASETAPHLPNAGVVVTGHACRRRGGQCRRCRCGWGSRGIGRCSTRRFMCSGIGRRGRREQ